MGVEVSLYLKKKPVQFAETQNPTDGITYDNVEDKCLFFDYFGGSWYLFQALKECGYNMDNISAINTVFYYKVKDNLQVELTSLQKRMQTAKEFNDQDYYYELEEAYQEVESCLNYWVGLYRTMDYNDILIVCSY